MIDLKAARELCKKATAGPWNGNRISAVEGYDIRRGELRISEGGAFTFSDTAFICAARTLLPEALDEIERLRAFVADTQDYLGPCNEGDDCACLSHWAMRLLGLFPEASDE